MNLSPSPCAAKVLAELPGPADILARVKRGFAAGAAALVLSGCAAPVQAPSTPREHAASAPVQTVQPGAPGQPTKVLSTGSPTPAPRHTQADVTFMQEMIHHHAQALEMVGMIQTHTARIDVQRLGERIDVSQTDELRMMKTWLTDRGAEVPMDHGRGQMMIGGGMMPSMPGMLTPAQMAALEKARGPEFDRLFLTGMIQHHEGALAMVEHLLQQPGAGQESMIFDFVTHVDADQRMEIARMRQLLAKDH